MFHDDVLGPKSVRYSRPGAKKCQASHGKDMVGGFGEELPLSPRINYAGQERLFSSP